MTRTSINSLGRPALIIAHPGHELRVHHWLEIASPLTFVLTKGDGAAGISRIGSTARLLAATGATPGSVFGRFEDRQIYDALLRGDVPLFVDVLNELVAALIDQRIAYVVADAEEGYNPVHDVCRYLAMAAAALASQAARHAVGDFELPLTEHPDTAWRGCHAEAIRVELDDEALARKMRAAAAYSEMKAEVARAIQAYGREAFRIESLRPWLPRPGPPGSPPFYETYGEQQVSAGRYADVVRYEQHVRPVKGALLEHYRPPTAAP